MNVKISIVIPCFNAERFIDETLLSIIGQDYDNYEVVVIDGGSTDDTLFILDRYRNNIAILVSEPDSGVPDALNKGFRLSTGDVLCWLNGDDVYINKSALSLVAKAFSKGDANFLYGHSVKLDSGGIVTKSQYAWFGDARTNLHGLNIFTGSLFFSKQLWLDFESFDPLFSVAFEYELIDFLFDKTSPTVLNEFLAGFRVYPGTISSRLDREMQEQLSIIRKDRLVGIKGRAFVNYGKRLFHLFYGNVLFEAICNSFSDKFRGQYWRRLFDVG